MHSKEVVNAPNTPERDANEYLSLSSEAVPIIDEPIQSAISLARRQVADPVIARFRDSLTNIQTSELERLYGRLPQLNDRSREAIQQFADCLISKMLHPPLECLRNESRNQSPDGLIDALQRLFRLGD